jgi:uncharacterized ferritin-like protein (DUF455 family)
MCLRSSALHALALSNPLEKVQAVHALWAARGELKIDPALDLSTQAAALTIPGRPEKPELVLPQLVPKRRLHTQAGRMALLHSVAHIEFNAINLALDAIWRFPNMPEQYYTQWASVADDEARHFTLLSDHLISRGFAYGDFTAHDGLWNMCEQTAHSVLARMALVPRTLEARGLDASPLVREKLFKIGEPEAAAIIDVILNDEIGHVAIGNQWYAYLCERAGLEPLSTFAALSKTHNAPRSKPPHNLAARRLAGFSEAELDALVNH